jgi:hypothetical protein
MNTFKTTGKSYIGYTNLTVAQRLHKHHTNATSGMSTHFYKAIRKYGIEDIETTILASCDTNEEARELEVENISKYDTFKNGYNLTIGGDGGSIANNLTGERLAKYLRLRSEATIGGNNPNHSGFSDDDLVSKAVELYNEEGLFTMNSWKRSAKKNGMPQSFSKNRFEGSFNYFRNLVLSKLQEEDGDIVMADLNYVKTKAHKDKLSQASSEWRWYNDGIENIRVHESKVGELNNEFKRGRIMEKITVSNNKVAVDAKVSIVITKTTDGVSYAKNMVESDDYKDGINMPMKDIVENINQANNEFKNRNC